MVRFVSLLRQNNQMKVGYLHDFSVSICGKAHESAVGHRQCSDLQHSDAQLIASLIQHFKLLIVWEKGFT